MDPINTREVSNGITTGDLFYVYSAPKALFMFCTDNIACSNINSTTFGLYGPSEINGGYDSNDNGDTGGYRRILFSRSTIRGFLASFGSF